jgi:hypothetical protein
MFGPKIRPPASFAHAGVEKGVKEAVLAGEYA